MSNLRSAAGRSTVYTLGGMVCSISPLAASAGTSVLRDGGNAFDAAIAAAAVEAVTVPAMCGLGGELFALLYEARSRKIFGVSGSGRAPMAAHRDYFVDKGYRTMPSDGPLSAAVPGEIDAYAAILERFGTRSLAQMLNPAIGRAEEGYPISPLQAQEFGARLDKLRMYPETAEIFTRNGDAYRAGDVLVQKNLAATLERAARGGPDEFYRGDTAREMVRSLRESGGLYADSEFAGHETAVYEDPISTTYRGYTVYQTAPPSQGFLVLEMLNILEGLDLQGMGFYTAEAIHAMVEAKKLAFADRNRHMGDPRFVDVPLDELISKGFASERRRLISGDRAASRAEAGQVHGIPGAADGDTSYLCVVDRDGNAVSLIHSLSNAFGSGFVAGSTGVLLNNRVGRGFSLVENHPNVIEPGKRTMHTLNAYMLFEDDAPYMIGGTPGGDNQVAWNVQVITNVVDHGMDAQEAVEAPRWTSLPGSDPATIDNPPILHVHEDTPPSEVDKLRANGHEVALQPPRPSSGSAKVIIIDHGTGVRMGGSDPRSDGHAAVD